MIPMAAAEATSATMDTNADRGVTAPTVSGNQKADVPKPPKKPLTPYMIFSKQIWPQVKAEHSHLSSVTELGAIVGQLWRDLDPSQKQQYNELYAQDKGRYDDEMGRYLKQTGLMASDVAKMRSKRPPHVHRPAAASTAVKDVAAAAGGLQAWPNGGVKQAAGQAAGAGGVLPTLYANHDGTITVGGVTAAGMAVDQKSNVLPASVYSDAQGGTLTSTAADAQRSWAWHQPVDGSNGVVMYQVAQGDQAAPSDGQQQGQQLIYNGIPTSGSSADSKAWLQSSGRVEQLETEIQRLRAALADKTREVENLRSQLNTLMHSLNKEPPRLTPDTLQTMPNAADVQLQSASVENNNAPKSDMPTTVVNGMPE